MRHVDVPSVPFASFRDEWGRRPVAHTHTHTFRHRRHGTRLIVEPLEIRIAPGDSLVLLGSLAAASAVPDSDAALEDLGLTGWAPSAEVQSAEIQSP